MKQREIKFRALDYKGDWQYGTYYHGVMYPESFTGDYVNNTPIDVKTLGQCAGLKDKNGKEIYEGDMALYPRVKDEDEVLGVVKYDEDLAAFVVDTTAGGWELLYIFMGENPTAHFEKNIYENPELLTLTNKNYKH